MTKDFETALELQLNGYKLTTAEILYHLPDHPKLLQSYIWQEYDLSPDYPELQRFLDFWESSIDGKLHTVKVASTEIIKPCELEHVDELFTIH